MLMKNRLREQVVPRLGNGENLQGVFPANTGPNPRFAFLAALTGCFFCFIGKYLAIGIFFLVVALIIGVITKTWVIAITDKRIMIFKINFFFRGVFQVIKGLVASFPRDIRVAYPSKRWAKIALGGKEYWVHKKYQDDLAEAIDADLKKQMHNKESEEIIEIKTDHA
jgi:hypothetical protein